MMRGKMKAQFYSIIALLITVPIFIFVTTYMTHTQMVNRDVSESVISDQLHQLSQSIETDSVKALEIAGRRALLAASNHVINSGKPLSDARANITELLENGVLNGSEEFMMLNNTLPNWSRRISSKAVHFDVELEYGNITIENAEGFSLRINMDMNLTVEDKLGTARIRKKNSLKSATVSLERLEDPSFPLNTQGFMRRMIREDPAGFFAREILSATGNGSCSGTVTFNKSECDSEKILVTEDSSGVVFACYEGIIMEDNEDLSGDISCYLTGNADAVELAQSITESSGRQEIYIDNSSGSAWSIPSSAEMEERYYYRGYGPDFIKRLEGDSSPSENGLVTFIYVPELKEQALPVESYSRLSHEYFSGTGSCSQVRNLPDWFGMDSGDASELGISDILTGDSCTS